MLQYLFLKWLWDELTRVEIMFLLDTPEFHSDQYMQACFRSANMLGKVELRRRLELIHDLIKFPHPFDRKRYIGLKSLGVTILTSVTPLPPVQKYTGWARHQRVSKGRKGDQPLNDWSFIPEPEIVVNPLLYLDLLLVEDPSLFRGRARILLTSPGSDET